MLALIGQTLDRYQVDAHLDDEFWGSLFKAHDPKFERTVVIQILSPQWIEKSKTSEYTLQAARAMMNWRHSGIARLYDFGQTSRYTYLVREYIPGDSLSQVLQTMRTQVRWINLSEALHLVIEVCRALAYAHQRNILHGDLYPGNVLFRPTSVGELPYQPVLVNLGLVKPTALHLVPTLPAYQTPETSQGGKIEKATDIYSLGILLFELATGQLPPVKLTNSISDTEMPQPPRSIRTDLPKALEQVILKAIARKPEDRYPDASAMVSALVGLPSIVAEVETAPPGFQEAISLLPAIQKSKITSPPETVPLEEGTPPIAKDARAKLDELASSEVDVSLDQIHILEPDQTVRSVSMKPIGMTIGRGEENDLVIDHTSVSRRHARIDFDGENYHVRDLKSLNGTFIEETRLSPDMPHVWLPGENMRVGEAWLRLELAGQAKTTQAMVTQASPTQPSSSTPNSESLLPSTFSQDTSAIFLHPDGRSIDPTQVKLSGGRGWVGVYAEAQNISIAPGNSFSFSTLLFNRGPRQDVFRLTLQGLPPDWIPSPPRPVSVPAGGQAEVRCTLHPPRSSEGKAGRYPVILRAVSQNASDQAVEVRITLTVTAFSQFTSELSPQQIPPGQLGQVTVHNRGNLPETYMVLLEDKQHELVFDPPQARINIPPGKFALVEFRPSPTQPRWFGGELIHSFNVYVSSQAGQLQSHRGEYISRGLIPFWAPIALILLCVIMSCLLIVFYNQLTTPSRYARQTAEAGQTALALAYQTTAQAATATAQFLQGANQSTIQAVTATAAWLVADDDQDGLVNNLELLAGTKPDVADTDEDGLKDGEEVNRWKTNPLVADTDADGLNDGKEIEKGTDPLKKDTDGDGIEDAIDPDPLHAPTKTPFIVSTFTPTSSTTPTRTNTPTNTLTPQINAADLTISITNGQAASIPGTSLVYTILVTNKGPGVITNAQVMDMFPSSITNVTWTCTASADSKCQTPNGINNINGLVDLAVNGTATFVANGVLSPAATGLLINTANVNAPTGITDLNTVDNLAIDTDTITPRVTLSITKTDSRADISPGQANTYNIVVTNNGPSAVNGVNITDAFPDKLSNVSWTCNATPGSSCQAIGTQYGDVNTSMNLIPGGSATINASATVKNNATDTLSNTAYITSPIDPINNNKNATDTTIIVSQVDLLVEVTTPLTATVSSPLTYTITITNAGPSDATNVSFIQTIPAGATFVSAVPGAPTCEALPDRVTCVFGSLPANNKLEIEIVLNTPAVPGPVVSQLQVDAKETDTNPTNNTATSTVQVE